MAIDNIVVAATNNFSPFLTTVGFSGLTGFLVGFAIKKVIKILAIGAGIFFATLIYLESQNIVNINWDKLQSISQGVLFTIVNTVNSTASGEVGGSPAASSSLLSTTMMTNLGIPLTGSTALGFAIGIMKG